MRRLDGITDSMDMSLVMDREAWHAVVPGVTKVRHDLGTEQQKQSIFGGQRESENSGNSFLSLKTRFQENLCLVSATSLF